MPKKPSSGTYFVREKEKLANRKCRGKGENVPHFPFPHCRQVVSRCQKPYRCCHLANSVEYIDRVRVCVYSTSGRGARSSRRVGDIVYGFLESAARARERTHKAALFKLEKIEKYVSLRPPEYVDTCLACQKKARAVIKDRVPISIVINPRLMFCSI